MTVATEFRITLRAAAVIPPPGELDPEEAFRAARRNGWSAALAALWAAQAAGLPLVDGEGDTIDWSMRTVRHLGFLRRLVRDGRLGGDDEGRVG